MDELNWHGSSSGGRVRFGNWSKPEPNLNQTLRVQIQEMAEPERQVWFGIQVRKYMFKHRTENLGILFDDLLGLELCS